MNLVSVKTKGHGRDQCHGLGGDTELQEFIGSKHSDFIVR